MCKYMNACIWIYRKSVSLFAAEVQIVNILGFLGHIASVTITQLCHCNAKAFIDIT